MRSWRLLSLVTRLSFLSHSSTSETSVHLGKLKAKTDHIGRYISNIEMPGGKIVYVPMQPPATGATKTSSAADWTIDFDQLEKAITPKTKMIVLNTPRE